MKRERGNQKDKQEIIEKCPKKRERNKRYSYDKPKRIKQQTAYHQQIIKLANDNQKMITGYTKDKENNREIERR